MVAGGAEEDAVRVLVADRQPMFGEAMARAIGRHPAQQVVGRTGDGYEAIALIASTHPDVAVLELALRSLDGLAVLGAVVRDELATRVLFISDAERSRGGVRGGGGRRLRLPDQAR